MQIWYAPCYESRRVRGLCQLSTLEAFVVLSLSRGGVGVGGGMGVRVFGEEIVCANIVFADGLTHFGPAFCCFFRFQTGANGRF